MDDTEIGRPLIQKGINEAPSEDLPNATPLETKKHGITTPENVLDWVRGGFYGGG